MPNTVRLSFTSQAVTRGLLGFEGFSKNVLNVHEAMGTCECSEVHQVMPMIVKETNKRNHNIIKCLSPAGPGPNYGRKIRVF